VLAGARSRSVQGRICHAAATCGIATCAMFAGWATIAHGLRRRTGSGGRTPEPISAAGRRSEMVPPTRPSHSSFRLARPARATASPASTGSSHSWSCQRRSRFAHLRCAGATSDLDRCQLPRAPVPSGQRRVRQRRHEPGAKGSGTGTIINIPTFDLTVFSTADLPAGNYLIGIACTRGPASPTQLDHFWSAKFNVSSGPTLSWTAPASSLATGASTGASTTVATTTQSTSPATPAATPASAAPQATATTSLREASDSPGQ